MKAMQPVSVNGIEFDALINENLTLEATVPQYAVEDGFMVSDAIIRSPETLSMTLYVTDTPVTWAKRHSSGRGRCEQVCEQIESLFFSGETVTVVTSGKTYTDMAIESLTIGKSAEIGYAREIPISFRKIKKTAAATASIPESYGKSGTTGAAAGSANTKSASSSGSGSDAGSGSKSSILYGAAKSIGLLK